MPSLPKWAADPNGEIPQNYKRLLAIFADCRDEVRAGRMLKKDFQALARKRLGLGGGSTNTLYRLMMRNREEQAPAPEPAAPEQKTKSITHLVIGDAHAAPGQNLERFVFLGRMIRDLRPDVVICIGDFADMPSLSSYDKGKKAYEGRRYTEDIKAANEAIRLLHKEIDDYNRTFPSDPVKPRFVYCEGNHEHRIERALNDAAGLDVMGLHDLDFARRGWEVFPFLTAATIDGVSYCHYFTSQNTARAISGVSAGRSLVTKKHTSCVVGHSHLFNHYTTTAGERRIHGLVVGWYCDVFKSYAGQSNTGWWSGICVLRDVNDGDFDLELWSYKRIKSRWS